MNTKQAVEYIEQAFTPDRWSGSMNGGYSLGTYAFGALIEPIGEKFRVRVGRNLGWGQGRDLVAQATFDTLEEAADFGMLIYKHQRNPDPDITDVPF